MRKRTDTRTDESIREQTCPGKGSNQEKDSLSSGGWNGILGWAFTAEECGHMNRACMEAVRFMESFGKPAIDKTSPAVEISLPEDMITAEAADFLGGDRQLKSGVRLGWISCFKKPGVKGYWYRTEDLVRYMEYLNQIQTGALR